MFFYAAVALSTFLISLLGTRLVILALRKKPVLMDFPNARSNHKAPTPRGGGVAVVFSLVIGLLLLDVGYSIVFALLLLASISLLDDLVSLSPGLRIVVQVVAVLVAMGGMEGLLFHGLLSPEDDRIVTLLIWLWFINLFNFMDGIDGLAGSEMIQISIGLCLVMTMANTFSDPLSLYALVTAAAGFGFLWWNWHPARIFLGDVGSVPVGFLLGYLLLLACHQGYYHAALILPAYFIADSTVTIVRRVWRGKRIWQAHSEHFYQQAVRGGLPHDAVVRHVLVANMLLMVLAVLATLDPIVANLNLVAAYVMVALLLRHFAVIGKKQGKEQGQQ